MKQKNDGKWIDWVTKIFLSICVIGLLIGFFKDGGKTLIEVINVLIETFVSDPLNTPTITILLP